MATTPSSPAPSNRENQSRATAGLVVVGVRWMGGRAFPSASCSCVRRVAKRLVPQVVIAECQQVEGHEGRGRGPGEKPHTGLRRMYPLGQRIEVETGWSGDDDLAVEDTTIRNLSQQRLDQFGEVPVERLLVATPQHDVRPVSKDDAAKPVPLRFVEEPLADRELAHQLGQHGRHRWGHGSERCTP